MKRRVTITLDPKLHDQAKRLARKGKTSVSGLLESFIKGTARDADEVGGVVDEMIGSASLREPTKHSDPLYDALHGKYVAEDQS